MIESAKRQNTVSYAVSILLLAIAVLSVVFIMLDIGEKRIWQFTGVLSFVFLVQFSSRYLMTRYEYSLTPSDELHAANQLIVVKITGKKRYVVCNVSLYNADYAISVSSRKEYIKKYKKSVHAEKCPRYDFCIDLFPDKFCILKLKSEYGTCFVMLECSDAFLAEMKSRI